MCSKDFVKNLADLLRSSTETGKKIIQDMTEVFSAVLTITVDCINNFWIV